MAAARFWTSSIISSRPPRSTSWRAVEGRSLTFSDTDEPERVLGAAVSWRLFSMLGIAPALGRDFSAADDRAGAAAVVILSDELWRRRYNADPRIVGRQLTDQYPALHRDRRAAATREVPVPGSGLDSARAALAGRPPPDPRSPGVRARRARPFDRAGPRGAGRHRGPARRHPRRERGVERTRQSALGVLHSRRREARHLHGDGRGHAGAPDRVRERRQPAAGAGHGSRARDVDPRGHRRRAAAASSASCSRRACCWVW